VISNHDLVNSNVRCIAKIDVSAAAAIPRIFAIFVMRV